MPFPRIKNITAALLETPLYQPFITSQGQADRGRCVAICLVLDDGREAFGEASPVTYVTQETIESVTKAVERAAPQLIGMEVLRYREVVRVIQAVAPAEPSARCGLEMALLNAWSLVSGLSLAQLWGSATDAVETDITIPITSDVGDLALLAWQAGIQTFKIKVGGGANLDADYARVAEVCSAAPSARIRVDANQAYTVSQALEFVNRLVANGVNLELLEQPVPQGDFKGLAEVAANSPVPVFADESAQTPAHALRLAQTAVQGFNCKVNKSGIFGVLDIIAIAKGAGRKLMLGCMLETRRSIALSLALACGTGAFDYIDLDSHLLLNEEGQNPCFHQLGGRMSVEFPTEG